MLLDLVPRVGQGLLTQLEKEEPLSLMLSNGEPTIADIHLEAHT